MAIFHFFFPAENISLLKSPLSLYYLTCSSCVVQHRVYSIAAYCWKEDCNSVLKRILSEKAFTFSSLTVPPFFCDTAGKSKKQVLVVAIGRVRYMSKSNTRISLTICSQFMLHLISLKRNDNSKMEDSIGITVH